MRMTFSEKKSYIEQELYHELRCLLGATTLWQIFKKDAAGFAMDSAFVHSRSLFNFFTKERTRDDISVVEFAGDPYESVIYRTWEDPLNRHVLHISKGRSDPTNVVKGTHLNEQVEVFAREILSLWKRLENDPAAKVYAAFLAEAEYRAVQDAANDAAGRRSPLFS